MLGTTALKSTLQSIRLWNRKSRLQNIKNIKNIVYSLFQSLIPLVTSCSMNGLGAADWAY